MISSGANRNTPNPLPGLLKLAISQVPLPQPVLCNIVRLDGKSVDLVVMKGDPLKRISDIENVEIVFKDGVGYDTAKLRESASGRYRQY